MTETLKVTRGCGLISCQVTQTRNFTTCYVPKFAKVREKHCPSQCANIYSIWGNPWAGRKLQEAEFRLSQENSHILARFPVFVNGQLLAMTMMYQDIAKMADRRVSILYL
jgi:hypothetical protein